MNRTLLFTPFIALFLIAGIVVISSQDKEVEKEPYEMPNIIADTYIVTEIGQEQRGFQYYTIQAHNVQNRYKMLYLDKAGKYIVGDYIKIEVKPIK